MSKDFKFLKSEIEKLAQIPPRSKGPKNNGSVPSAGTSVPTKSTNTSVPSRGKPGYNPSKLAPQSTPEIREMQLSMQDLAEAVMQDASSSTMALKNRDTLHQDANQHVQQSKKSFNDFSCSFDILFKLVLSFKIISLD